MIYLFGKPLIHDENLKLKKDLLMKVLIPKRKKQDQTSKRYECILQSMGMDGKMAYGNFQTWLIYPPPQNRI